MRRLAILLLPAAVLLAAPTTPAQAAPAPVAKVLKSTLTKLKAATDLPILLPSFFPVDPLEGKPLYPEVTASAKRWDVVLGYVPDCNGANVCAAGNLAAVKTARTTSAADGAKVKLRGGRTGRYRGPQCGANCSAPAIVFRRDGVTFTIQAKLTLADGQTDRQALIKVANSALAGGLR